MSGETGADDSKDQEPWIGVVPVEMDDSKASTGNQESFADAVVNKVSGIIFSFSCHTALYKLSCYKDLLFVLLFCLFYYFASAILIRAFF